MLAHFCLEASKNITWNVGRIAYHAPQLTLELCKGLKPTSLYNVNSTCCIKPGNVELGVAHCDRTQVYCPHTGRLNRRQATDSAHGWGMELCGSQMGLCDGIEVDTSNGNWEICQSTHIGARTTICNVTWPTIGTLASVALYQPQNIGPSRMPHSACDRAYDRCTNQRMYHSIRLMLIYPSC